MGTLIPIHGDPHEQVEKLLPWYVNGTLSVDEAALVDAHIAECAACRAELGQERALGRGLAALASDVDHGWEALQQRMTAPQPRKPWILRALGRRLSVGWLIGGQLAVASIAAIVVLTWPMAGPSSASGEYRLLGSPKPAPVASVIILFRPQTSLADMRQALTDVDAHIVDGPLASGGYMLRLPAGAQADALEKLRGSQWVLLAEPLGAKGSQ